MKYLVLQQYTLV